MTPKATETSVVLIVGSGPNALDAVNWPRSAFERIVAINNAWRVRRDWDVLIHPEDFPKERWPDRLRPGQRRIEAADYVPVQNAYGGFVYAGGTMAFTAGYWALGALKPKVMAFIGCDMVYSQRGETHFYGTGAADPLRADVTLRSLEAKAARLAIHASAQGALCVNLSKEDSRLVFPRADAGELDALCRHRHPEISAPAARALEADLDYRCPSGRYWEEEERFDPGEIDLLDDLWLQAFRSGGFAAVA